MSPAPFSSQDAELLRQAELDVSAAFADRPFDFDALQAISNVFRAATAIRNHMESQVLRQHRLSWSAFVVLFVLRVWGQRESNELALEAGITPGTLTGVVGTLERRGYARRRAHPTDGRRQLVAPTASGRRAIDEIMPMFNDHESKVTAAFTDHDRRDLSRLLRVLLGTLEEIDSP